MIKRFLFGIVFIALFCSHDMFLKLDGFFLEPQTQAVIALYNGTFEKSDNVIARNRMLDVSLVGNGKRMAIDSAQWYEEDNITFLKIPSGDAGTKLVGVSTAPRNISLSAEDFNRYLEHDGVVDMLNWRKENNAMDQDAVERYSKHVKTIFQVGETQSNDWSTVLGYPIEFVPLENPYDVHTGHTLAVKLLLNGSLLANQWVYVGHETSKEAHEHDHHHDHNTAHSHDHDDDHANTGHQHPFVEQLLTDEKGIVEIDITAKGVWYLRTIHMAQSKEEGLTHESNWATLTFAIGDGHSHDHDDHDSDGHQEEHDHDNDDHDHHWHIPSYAYWIGSIVLILVLFLVFNRKT
ncbi:MAG: DUF4198 domain-containing protein [Bacteroidota bacterium]